METSGLKPLDVGLFPVGVIAEFRGYNCHLPMATLHVKSQFCAPGKAHDGRLAINLFSLETQTAFRMFRPGLTILIVDVGKFRPFLNLTKPMDKKTEP
jgi:hypothetical protein